MKKVIEETLSKLGSERRAFHSEDDFKHALAFGLHIALQKENANIRVEVPVRDIMEKGVDIYIDLLVITLSKKYPIELKYKTRKSEFELGREFFKLKNHYARDVGRYSFRKDIYRLEKLIEQQGYERGYAIILSNDANYWQKGITEKFMDGNYRIAERVLKKDKGWIYPNTPYYLKYYDTHPVHGYFIKKGTKEKHWTQSKNFNTCLTLRKEYKVDWKKFSIVNEQLFKYCIVEIQQN